jgi:hypothetical protein
MVLFCALCLPGDNRRSALRIILSGLPAEVAVFAGYFLHHPAPRGIFSLSNGNGEVDISTNERREK